MGHISDYMSRHRFDNNIQELKTYFTTVIDWVSGIFIDVEKEMCGLEWGRLYEEYHGKAYDPIKVSAEVHKLFGDPYVKNRKGVFEYVLGGSVDTKLIDIRVFDEATKRAIYEKQTSEANGISNCPLCSLGSDANKSKIWRYSEMEADHVTAWSKGGDTNLKNCQMLCKTHNRSKGNR
jgi:hypothetical protein